MKATIASTGETINGRNLHDIRRQLMQRLSIEKWRALNAITPAKTIIHVSLYDNEDYILTADRRNLLTA